jgi:hypothetical protein
MKVAAEPFGRAEVHIAAGEGKDCRRNRGGEQERLRAHRHLLELEDTQPARPLFPKKRPDAIFST